MGIPLNFTKDTLVAALESKRPIATKLDEEALRVHQKAEQHYLRRFRETLRDALKWDYNALKAHRFNVKIDAREGEPKGYDNDLQSPTCPSSVANRLDRCIAIVRGMRQDRFRIEDSGKYRDIYEMLTIDLPARKGLC